MGDLGRQKLLEGANILAAAVSTTLGPRGRTAIIEQPYGIPKITKDGVSVAKSITLEDPVHDMGAEIIKQVANLTNEKSGDGTTTASIIANKLLEECIKIKSVDLKPLELYNGIQMAVEHVIKYLENNALKPTKDDIFNVAKISCNNDQKIASIIVEAIEKVGKEGVINIIEGKSFEHSINYVEGYEFDRGYISPFFVTDIENSKCIFEDDVKILIIGEKLNNIKTILPALEETIQSNSSLLIIADDIDTEVLNTLIINRIKGGLKVCVVKAPSFGEYKSNILDDIAAKTGAIVYNNISGDKIVNNNYLGAANKVVIGKDACLLFTGEITKNNVKARTGVLKKQLENANLNSYEREKLEERIAKLTGKVAIIHVGGLSEAELNETKDRIEDAVCAAKAALASGILPGGGTAFLYASKELNKLDGKTIAQNLGIEVIKKVLKAPITQILKNAGYEHNVIINNLLTNHSFGQGFDVISGKYVDMFNCGIVDPLTVLKTSIREAATVAGLVATSETIVHKLHDSQHDTQDNNLILYLKPNSNNSETDEEVSTPIEICRSIGKAYKRAWEIQLIYIDNLRIRRICYVSKALCLTYKHVYNQLRNYLDTMRKFDILYRVDIKKIEPKQKLEPQDNINLNLYYASTRKRGRPVKDLSSNSYKDNSDEESDYDTINTVSLRNSKIIKRKQYSTSNWHEDKRIRQEPKFIPIEDLVPSQQLIVYRRY